MGDQLLYMCSFQRRARKSFDTAKQRFYQKGNWVKGYERRLNGMISYIDGGLSLVAADKNNSKWILRPLGNERKGKLSNDAGNGGNMARGGLAGPSKVSDDTDPMLRKVNEEIGVERS
ncbi:hypothetical protein LWI29_028469 [Acer saccharum]|uniref:Uncharacterized protein n=1 Tax=Acer saccharum TaxID=4024 RepID=A0AA39TN21_ACESA|nr:hypothetical protein LWI29_028469 [Acer saccharum]